MLERSGAPWRHSWKRIFASSHSLIVLTFAMPDDIETDKIKKTIYFAYGSNLWMDQMNRRCPENKYVGIGVLHDW